MARAALPIAVAGALALGAVSVKYGSFTAGGSDSYGYVSEAYGWVRGELPSPIPLPYALPFANSDMMQIPLGYHEGPRPHTMVPTYAPGVPLLMAAGILVGGVCGPFLVTPICAAALVWFTFLLARRAGGELTGAVAAIVIAATPVVLFQAVAPMSDIPAGAFWTAALWFALSGSRTNAVAAGVCTAIGLLIRPNIVPLAAVPVIAAAISAPRGRGRWMRAALVAIPPVIAAISIAALNSAWYGSPGASGYGRTVDLYTLGNILPNIRLYAAWFIESESPWALIGIFALVPRFRTFADARAIGVAVAAIAVTLACYLPYAQFEVWWYLRFLLPAAGAAACLIAVGIVALACAPLGVWGRLAAASTLVALLTTTVSFAERMGVFGLLRDGERHYIEVGEFVSHALPADAVILAIQHSGSLRFYGGRMTVRFDWIEKGMENRAVGEFERLGLHPYLVVDDFEQPQFREQFGVPKDQPLSFPVVARLREWGGTTVFDLGSHPAAASPVALEPGSAPRCGAPRVPLRVR
jgi:hypothetical protein